MRVLALDTSTRAGSVAVMDGDRVLVERAGDGSRTHAERLPREILDALDAAGLSSAEIDLFAVACGPGSFTGLRIGIATIQGFAFVHSAPVAPVSALRALAEVAAAGAAPGTCVGAWMDAHRRDVFSAVYEVASPAAATPAVLVELEPAAVGPPSDTLVRWHTCGWVPASLAGDGATMYADLLPAHIRLVGATVLGATIARLAVAAAAAGRTVTPEGVQPLYVRRPDAEVAREAFRVPR